MAGERGFKMSDITGTQFGAKIDADGTTLEKTSDVFSIKNQGVKLDQLDFDIVISQAKTLLKVFMLESSESLISFDARVGDIFTDADGLYDTIDTGNTTSTFDTDHYVNADAVDTDATEYDEIGGSWILAKTYDYTANNIKLNTTITADLKAEATEKCVAKFKITYADDTNEETAEQNTESTSYVGKTFTFTNSGSKLVKRVQLYMVGGNIGTKHIYAKDIDQTYPQESLIQTALLTTTTDDITGMMVIVNTADPTNITGVSVSADNGSTWTAGDIDEKIVPSVLGKNPKVKITQDSPTGENTYGFMVVLWH